MNHQVVKVEGMCEPLVRMSRVVEVRRNPVGGIFADMFQELRENTS